MSLKNYSLLYLQVRNCFSDGTASFYFDWKKMFNSYWSEPANGIR